uniref:G-protein coupled receptors family 1 profile domain-containing protein n=1 Tax=Romanomermis culicivorax TaxID=13658 RepID=A0A915IB38_ROMCU
MSNSGNCTTKSSYPVEMIVIYSYEFILIGGLSFLSNLLLLFHLVSDKIYRKTTTFMILLSIGDTINGLALSISGLWRLIFAYNGMFNSLCPVYMCYLRFTSLWVVGT